MTITCPAADRPAVADRLTEVARTLTRFGYLVFWPEDGDHLDVHAGAVEARVSIDANGRETVTGSDGVHEITRTGRSGISDGHAARQILSDLRVMWRANHESLPPATGLVLTRCPDLDVLGVLFYAVRAVDDDPSTVRAVIVRSNPSTMAATSWRPMADGGHLMSFPDALSAARAAMA